jgi:uncharacterized protein YndB with AHSA1/START domain
MQRTEAVPETTGRRIRITAERHIAAPAATVYRYLADYREHHPRILPPAFSNLRVEQGGIGEGTIITFEMKLGGSTRSVHQRVSEPEPGRVLAEADAQAGAVTTFTVTPEGPESRVRIETTWQPRGLAGLLERLFAPRMLPPLYADELERLDRYAREQAASA